MERYFSSDQDKLFEEAHVINPFRKGPVVTLSQVSQNSRHNPLNATEECGVCFMTLPTSVNITIIK